MLSSNCRRFFILFFSACMCHQTMYQLWICSLVLD
jgi:hypothetical protein